jgi:hypothetical protein
MKKLIYTGIILLAFASAIDANGQTAEKATLSTGQKKVLVDTKKQTTDVKTPTLSETGKKKKLTTANPTSNVPKEATSSLPKLETMNKKEQ